MKAVDPLGFLVDKEKIGNGREKTNCEAIMVENAREEGNIIMRFSSHGREC